MSKNNLSEQLKSAIEQGEFEIVQALIEKGVDVNQKIQGGTPLSRACYHLNLEITSLLIDAGADVNAIYEKHKTALTQACDAYHKPKETVKKLVKLLLDRGAKVDLSPDKVDGPLHYACMYGYPEAADLLIKAGAAINQKGDYGRTPLMYAACVDAATTALLLKAGATVQDKNEGKENALFELITRGTEGVKTVELLIEYGIDLEEGNQYDDNALHWAAFCGQQEIVACLLDAGMDIELKNKRGETTLQRAMSRQNLSLVKYLVGRGASTLLKDFYTTVLAFAADQGDSDFVISLLQQESKSPLEKLNSQGALGAAAEKGNLDLARKLIGFGVAVDERKSETDDTPLAKAAYNGRTEMLVYLLEQGADVNKANYKGNTALLNAAWKGQLQIIKILLEAGVDINQRNHHNWNALMQACEQKQAHVVQFLLEQGSPTDEVDKEYGVTALTIARLGNATKIVTLLESHGAKERAVQRHSCSIFDCGICAYLEDKKELPKTKVQLLFPNLEPLRGYPIQEAEVELASSVYGSGERSLLKCPNCATIYYNSYSVTTEEWHIIKTSIDNNMQRVNLLRLKELLHHVNQPEELAELEAAYPALMDLFQTKITQASETISPYHVRYIIESLADFFIEQKDWKSLETCLLQHHDYKVALKTVEHLVAACKWALRDNSNYPSFSNTNVQTPKIYERTKAFLDKHLDSVLAYLNSYKNNDNKDIQAFYELTNRTVVWMMKKG